MRPSVTSQILETSRMPSDTILDQQTAWTSICQLEIQDESLRLSIDFVTVSLLIDTNVVSELIRNSPDPEVVKWATSQRVEGMFLTTVSEAELRFGAEILPRGRRRETLILRIENMLTDVFGGRILSFDSVAARNYAVIAAKRHLSEYSMAVADCQIAAIARSVGMKVVTRNARDFLETGVETVNPWAFTSNEGGV